MLTADLLQQLHLVPRPVRDVIGEAAAQGCSKPVTGHATYAWVLHRQSLLVWTAEDGAAATVRRLTLPWAPVDGTFVEVLPQRQSTALTVIVCTAAGWLHVWLDATFGGEPFNQQVVKGSDGDEPNLICALTATPADAGASPAFLAVIATADAALHLYHGSQNGIFPRQFYNPRGAASTQGGVFQAITAAVGTAKKVAVDYNLLVGIPHLRTSASTAPATQLQLLRLDSNRWKLFVLTRSAESPEQAQSHALDCWLLGTLSGKQSSEQLLWSLDVHQAVMGRNRVSHHRVLGFTASAAPAQQQLPTAGQETPGGAPMRPSTEVIYVWSSSMLADSASAYQHTCSAFAVEDGPRQGPRLMLSAVIPTAAAMPSPKLKQRWQLLAHGQLPSCLLLAPNGVLVEWLRTAEGLPNVLSGSETNVAIASSGYSSDWQVLNREFGVLEFTAQGSPSSAPQHPIDAAKALLERVVGMMEQAFAERCSYRELATGLAACLSRLGMLDSAEGRALLIAASSGIVDSLPRSSTLGFDSLRAMLADKQTRHDLYLLALHAGGAMQRMPPSVLATLFEHAQMLHAAAGVLEYQRNLEGAASDMDALTQVDRLQPQASQRVIEAAGSLAAAGAGEAAASEQLHEVFFGRPTISMPALFQAVAAQAAHIRRSAAGAGEGTGGVQALLHQLLGLSGLLAAAADASSEMMGGLKEFAQNEVSKAQAAGPGWLAGEGPRAAWSELSEACLLVLPMLSELPHQQQLAHLAHLPALSHLLVALQATLNDASDPSVDMVVAYRELPWRHGQQILMVAQAEIPVLRSRGVLDVSPEGLQGSDDDNLLALLPGLKETLVWRLQTLAQQHDNWELLYATCEVMQGINSLLEDQMQQLMRVECNKSGATLSTESFTYFVMQRLHSQHRVVDLLELGRVGFPLQLQAYLADYPHLLWMSHVQAQQYSAATGTLCKAAAAAPVQDAQRLWALTKLSGKASGARDGSGKQSMVMATARLRQLALQAALLPGRQQPMLAEELASAALRAAGQAVPAGGTDQGTVGLRGADAAVAAVEVLALEAGKSNTQSYRDLWESSWTVVLQTTSLQHVADERARVPQAGLESDAYAKAVEDCPLFKAFVIAAEALKQAASISADVSVTGLLEKEANRLEAQLQESSLRDAYSDVVAAAAASCGIA